MAVSCAFSILSKLNVNPFQIVNSPLDAPVINLLPSGVQETTFIGHLTLFVDVCINFVVTLLSGGNSEGIVYYIYKILF